MLFIPREAVPTCAFIFVSRKQTVFLRGGIEYTFAMMPSCHLAPPGYPSHVPRRRGVRVGGLGGASRWCSLCRLAPLRAQLGSRGANTLLRLSAQDHENTYSTKHHLSLRDFDLHVCGWGFQDYCNFVSSHLWGPQQRFCVSSKDVGTIVPPLPRRCMTTSLRCFLCNPFRNTG